MSAHKATSSKDPLGRSVCSPSVRTGTLFCLSPYSHDPVSLRHCPTAGFFLFVSSLTILLPPLQHQHLILTFRLERNRGGFSLCCPHIVLHWYFGTSVTFRGAGADKACLEVIIPQAGVSGVRGHRASKSLLTVSFLGRAFSASLSLRLGFVPRGACCVSIVEQLWEPTAQLSTGALGQCQKALVLLTHPMGSYSCGPEGPISNEKVVSTSASWRFLFCTQIATKEQVWMEALCPWQASLRHAWRWRG